MRVIKLGTSQKVTNVRNIFYLRLGSCLDVGGTYFENHLQ